MRILILTDLFSLEDWILDDKPPKIMPAVYNFFNYLGHSKQHSFHAICFHPKSAKKKYFPNGSLIESIPLKIKGHYPRKFFSFFRMKKEAEKRIEKEKFDVVYGMAIYATVASWVGQRKKLPSVSRIFGSLIYDVIKKKEYFKLYTRFIFQYLEAKFPCDLIICTEDGTEFDKAIQHINPKRDVKMLYNGIERELKKELLSIEPISKLPRKNHLELISIGRLTQWKRHDLSIRVLYHLFQSKHIENAYLTILGAGEEKEHLLHLVERMKLEDHVTFMDPVPHEEIPALLANYHIALFMYDASNLGNSLWEAALSGRIICARPTGKTSEILHNGEDCIIANDPKDFTRQIIELLENNQVNYGKNARKTVDKLLPYWEERFEKELDLIGEMI